MHAQGEDAGFIAGRIGVDPSSPLSYSTYVDPSGQNFTFSLKSGATYLGHPITLNASGVLNPSTQTWSVASAGTYGGSRWIVTSSLVPAPAPNSSTVAFNSSAKFDTSGLNHDIPLYDGVYCSPAFGYEGSGWSEERCYYTWKGQRVGPGWLAGDGYGNWGWWNWYWEVNIPYFQFSLAAQGSTPIDGGAGTFSTVVGPAQPACVSCSATDGSGVN